MEGVAPEDLLARARDAWRRADADPAASVDDVAALVDELRRAGHTEALVVALRAQAWAERGRLADARAKALLDEAARRARAEGLQDRLGEVLVSRAAVNQELGRLAAAQADLRAAAPLVTGAATAQWQLQQAVLHQNSGRLAQAATLYRALLGRHDTTPDIRGKVGNNLGMVEAQRGLTDSALRCLDEAAVAAADVGPALTASVLQTRAGVCVQAGRLSEGLRLFDEALRAFEASGLPVGELHMEYGDALVDLRLLPEAAVATSRAVKEFEDSGVPLMAAEAQLRSAQLALLSGEDEDAAASAEKAGATFRRQRRPAWAARADVVGVEARLRRGLVGPPDRTDAARAAATLQRLGMGAGAVHAHLTAARVALALERPRAAGKDLRRARALSRGAPVLVRLDGRIAAALEARLLRRDAEVARHCRVGLADLAAHRSALPSMELRALAAGHGLELGRMGVEGALRNGSATTVLRWLERTRATMHALVAPPVVDGVPARFAELRALHARAGEPAYQRPEDQRALAAEQRELEARLRRAAWANGDGAATAVGPVGLGQLRHALDGRVLVEYGVLEGRLFAVVLQSRSSRLVELGDVGGTGTQDHALPFALRRLARPGCPPALAAAARASADAALGRLREALLAPLALAPDAPLVVVPSAALQRVPWSALHAGPVSLAPSASSWVRSRAHDVEEDARAVLVAGPDLPGAVDEVAALERLYGAAVVLRPPASTVEAVAAALDGAAVAHLACHGRLRADNPTFSSLLLSDGPLTLQELDDRGLAPRRIVLASCESGAQVQYAGDELLGFVSALMARGTGGIVASTVVVPDAESVPFMSALHAAARHGATLADALHTARAAVDRDAPAGYAVWCAYDAYGAA